MSFNFYTQIEDALAAVFERQREKQRKTLKGFRHRIEREEDPIKLIPLLSDSVDWQIQSSEQEFEGLVDQFDLVEMIEGEVSAFPLQVANDRLNDELASLKDRIKDLRTKRGQMRKQDKSHDVADKTNQVYGPPIRRLWKGLVSIWPWAKPLDNQCDSFKELLVAYDQQLATKTEELKLQAEEKVLSEVQNHAEHQLERLNQLENLVSRAKAVVEERLLQITGELRAESHKDSLSPFAKIKEFQGTLKEEQLESLASELRREIGDKQPDEIVELIEEKVEDHFKPLEGSTVQERLEELYALEELVQFLVDDVVKVRCRPLFPSNDQRQDEPLETTVNLSVPEEMDLNLPAKMGRISRHDQPNRIEILVTEHDRCSFELVNASEYRKAAEALENTGLAIYPERDWEEKYRDLTVAPAPVSANLELSCLLSDLVDSEASRGPWIRLNGEAVNGRNQLRSRLGDPELQSQVKTYWQEIFANEGIQGVIDRLEHAVNEEENGLLNSQDRHRLKSLIKDLRRQTIRTWADVERVLF